jgi:hypothetical protein
MKKLAVAVLFGLTTLVAHAQIPGSITITRPMTCNDTVYVLKMLAERFDERPEWIGSDLENKFTFMLTTNDKAPSWTLLQMNNETACVLGAGTTPNFIKKNKL